MNTEIYRKRDWVFSVFAACEEYPTIHDVKYPYQIIQDVSNPEVLFYAKPKDDGGYEAVHLEGSKKNHVIYKENMAITLEENDIPLTHEPNTQTTLGIILGNMYLLYYPFKNKFNFFNGIITKAFDQRIVERLTDDVAPGEKEDPNKIYIHELLKYNDACDAISGFDHLFASSGSGNIITVHQSVIELRNQLLEKHKHELMDPRVQADIESQLVAADKASFKDDRDARNFLITGKSFNPTRKKQLILIGGSGGFGSDGTQSFIPTSLNEGWKVEDIPIHANEARAGSYFRGKETANGGTKVKEANRMAMDTEITKEFCGATIGLKEHIHETQKSKYLKRYMVSPDGPVLLTKDNIDQYVGKTVELHSPQYCKVDGANYCKICIGLTWAALPKGLSNVISNIGDVFMYDKMKRMHGKALATAIFTPLYHIS